MSGEALGSTSLDGGRFTVRGTEFSRNSAPQCGAVDLKADENNSNFQTRNGLNMELLSCSFANNLAKEGRGGAICASAVSVSVASFDSIPDSRFTWNSAVTGGGAISTTNSALTISEASFSDNSAHSGGDAIHACSSKVTVESSDGLLGSSKDGECFLFSNNMTFIDKSPGTNGGVTSYCAINWPLFSFMIIILCTYTIWFTSLVY